jgi:hypothetical protein
MFALAPVLIFLLVLVALIDIITRSDDQVKHLPKLVWVLLVVFLPVLGSILWFAVGREYAPRVDRGTFGDPRRRSDVEGRSDGMSRSSRSRPLGSSPLGSRPLNARSLSTEEQLAELDAEIEHYNAQARISQLESELKKKRELPE